MNRIIGVSSSLTNTSLGSLLRSRLLANNINSSSTLIGFINLDRRGISRL